MATDETKKTDATETKTISKEDIEKNKVWALVSYLTVIGLIVAMVSDGKDSPFVKFHVNQSLTLVIATFANFVFAAVPIIGWLLAPFIGLGILILTIMGILNAANGQVKRLPLVGNYDLIK